MANQHLESAVSNMSELLFGIATGSVALAQGTGLERYDKARKRLQALAPLLGPLPQFLAEAEDGWSFWNNIKRFSTYQERRDFLSQNYTAYYSRLLASRLDTPWEQVLGQRDLVVEEEIGRGGFGVVYRARHMTLEIDRAVKVFDPMFFAGDEGPLRRFAREARLLSTLGHPNIVRFFDAGIAGNRPFIITQCVDGKNLQKQIDEEGSLPEATVREIIGSAASALHYAHERQVFHRDIKPSNLMWDSSHVTILDLGSGIAVQETLTTRITTTALGTPGFIAPELFEDPAITTPGVDIFSLGVTAHYLLTARQPYLSDFGRYLNSSGVSERFQEVIRRCVLPPEDRFQTAQELADSIRELSS